MATKKVTKKVATPERIKASPAVSKNTDNEEVLGGEVPTKITSKAVEEEENLEEEYDYLQKYQYKKVNNKPVIGGPSSNPDKGSKAEVMKASLLTQKKVNMLIPLPEGSDPKVLHSVTLNGYRLDFPTNTYIDVPYQIAEVVRKSNNQTVIAQSQFLAVNAKGDDNGRSRGEALGV